RLEERRISVDLENRTIITPCPKSDCDFSDGLPIVVVDEAIYESPPTFVIATIDKLAQLSSVPDMSKILGRDTKHDPPDLIIQDELHLINDALGTVAALFEMATEFLATNADGSLPKLVGSTATIRQADHQIRCLYRKSLMQFPPNGISISDSFFYRTDTDNPGRLYLGIHAQGKSPKHTLSVVLALLAQLPQRISDKEERDPFHTVVAYFNSLRELGGAHALAEDDVQRLLDQLPLEAGERKRILTYIVELTSQLQSEDIKSIFSQLEVELHGENDSSEPLDLVLASNMISVGVDIDRLGLMVVNGQPKTTSECIQATSRIGRRAGSAGLVVTIYNWTRPRDRSHYERFTGYHETFYRYVEAVSVTPFAARARERALTAALVAMMRGSEYFRSNKLDLTRIANLKYSNTAEHALVQSIKDKLRDRVTSVEPDALKATLGEFEEFIDEIIQQAEHCVKMDKSLYWLEPSDEEPRGDTILQRSDGSNNRGYGRIIPLSMRDVDPPVPVVSLRR
ncbi:MAG: helicase, partial [Candidatus Latescibacteria bacterium]|nr:helicase [Candidatus Latescibacterota bacterium]